MKRNIQLDHIAPCGMNCGICSGFLREKNTCPGCRHMGEKTSLTHKKYLRKCIIRNCPEIEKNKWKFCSSKCTQFPCQRMKALDKRYRTRYRMSMIENLQYIEKNGIRAFVKKENKRWACSTCDGVVCVHKGHCMTCQKKK